MALSIPKFFPKKNVFDSCVATLFLVGLASSSQAFQITEVDWLDMDSVVINESAGTAQFSVWESLTDISTSYTINLATGQWSAWESTGHYKVGDLSTEGAAFVPCLTGPVQLASCLAVGASASWFCDRRDARALNRAIASCNAQGGTLTHWSAGVCGSGGAKECSVRVAFQVP